jgi:hypothetical protein
MPPGAGPPGLNHQPLRAATRREASTGRCSTRMGGSRYAGLPPTRCLRLERVRHDGDVARGDAGDWWDEWDGTGYAGEGPQGFGQGPGPDLHLHRESQ